MTPYRTYLLLLPTRRGPAVFYNRARAYRRNQEQLLDKTALANWEDEGGRIMDRDAAPSDRPDDRATEPCHEHPSE